jgi:hypothetical protein
MGGYEISSVLIVVTLGLAIVFLVFLVMREVMCWYWKINEAVYLLRSIDEKLGNRGAPASSGQSGKTDSEAMGQAEIGSGDDPALAKLIGQTQKK